MKSTFVNRVFDFRITPAAFGKLDLRDVADAIERHMVSHDLSSKGSGDSSRPKALVGRLVSIHADRNHVRFYISTAPNEPNPVISLANE